MSSPITFPPPGFDDLSKEEQLAYIEELAAYASAPDGDEIPEWHWKILDARMATPGEDLENGMAWEEFEKELDRELRQS